MNILPARKLICQHRELKDRRKWLFVMVPVVKAGDNILGQMCEGVVCMCLPIGEDTYSNTCNSYTLLNGYVSIHTHR